MAVVTNPLLSMPVGSLLQMPRDYEIVKLAEAYIDRYYGDTDIDPETNGEYRLLEKLLPFCRTVFDVGAAGGFWARHALSVNPQLNLHCFEPLPINQTGLVEALAGRAVINGFALGAVNGRLPFHVVSEHTGDNWQLGSLYGRNQGQFGASVELSVDVLTVEEYCRRAGVEHIDFLKIDVEGAELDVLTGAVPLFREGRIMAAQFEYGGTWLDARRQLRDVFDLLRGTDYVLAKIIPDGYRVIADYWLGLDSYRYSNWLVLHKDIASDS